MAQLVATQARSFPDLRHIHNRMGAEESVPALQMAPEDKVIAIVDDNDMVRDLTAALLARIGYRVRTFESGDAFLAAIWTGNPDCVLLDMRMPGTDGFGVLRALAAWKKMPPVLVVTAHGAVPEAVEAMKLGAADFLEKPYPAEALLGAIGTALESGTGGKAGAAQANAVARIGRLSQRQLQVLRGIIDGRPNKIIAWELGLSIRTVEAYRAELLERLGVRGTAEAIHLAAAAGMLDS